jgi:hypothetical protein
MGNKITSSYNKLTNSKDKRKGAMRGIGSCVRSAEGCEPLEDLKEHCHDQQAGS